MIQLTLYVLGISCVNSAQSIEKYIKSFCGIISVSSSLPKGKIVIKFKPSLVSTMEIIDQIEDRGFAVLKKIKKESSFDIYN